MLHSKNFPHAAVHGWPLFKEEDSTAQASVMLTVAHKINQQLWNSWILAHQLTSAIRAPFTPMHSWIWKDRYGNVSLRPYQQLIGTERWTCRLKASSVAGNFFPWTWMLGIEQVLGCAYRPQTQGAVERFHRKLKSMIRTYLFDHKKEWDVGLPYLVFAARDMSTSLLDAIALFG